nr:hypothetical protein [uncultured Moellerella sp.]
MDGHSGIIIISFSIFIGFVILFLVLPVIILSLFDKGSKARQEVIQKNSSKWIEEQKVKSLKWRLYFTLFLMPYLYAMLALVEDIRLGKQREIGLAAKMLEKISTEI